MIYYFEFNEKYLKYMRKDLGNEEIENNKCFTIDGSGDSFKVNVYCNVELALKPNTIVLSKDEELNNYWWVVQEDKSTLIDNNLYLHELQLVGAIEWFKFKFCYTGTFYYHRYSYFEVMQKLLYSLWKPKFFDFNLGNFTSEFGSKKNNQKFTFKGYTIRSALSEIEKALNVDFKLKFVTSKLSIEETVSGTTGSHSFDPTPDGTGAYYPGNISTTISPNYIKVVIKSVTPSSASATISSYNSSTGAIKLKIKSATENAHVTVTLKCTTEENVAEYGYYNISILETQKVDLTDYQTKALDTSVTINGETKTTVNDSLTAIANYISGLKSGTNVVEKANKANQLVTARTISLSGDATGSISFDGSSNKTLSVTLANSGVTAGTYSVVTVDAKGRATSGGQIIEVGGASQTTPSASLAVGGIFFKVI